MEVQLLLQNHSLAYLLIQQYYQRIFEKIKKEKSFEKSFLEVEKSDSSSHDKTKEILPVPLENIGGGQGAPRGRRVV